MITIIVPAFNEAENVRPLYERLEPVLKKLRESYEIIFVDDGSTDGTAFEVRKLGRRKVKLISFTKNFGKAAALQAGFNAANGRKVITMDCDLQDLPEEIPSLLKGWGENDLVVGWRYERKDRFGKRVVSKFFNYLARKLTGLQIHDANCGFKAMKREVAKSLNVYGELHRYVPALAYAAGYKVGEVKIKHAPRLHGKTKYGIGRMWKGFFDLLTVRFLGSFAKRPFHLFGGVGLVSLVMGSLIGLWLFGLWFFSGDIGGHTPLAILSMLFVVLGMQLISLGFLGEMIAAQKREGGYEIKRKV